MVNLDIKDSYKHPRLVEFHDSRFYSTDFINRHFTFLTVYDTAENVLLEFAHVLDNIKDNFTWVTPRGECLKCGALITAIMDACDKNSEVLIDLYVNDVFKPNPRLEKKRIFRYCMTVSDSEGKIRLGHHKSKAGHLYNLDVVSDTTCFSSFTQLFD